MQGWHYGKGLISYWYYMFTKPGQGKWVCNLNKLVVSKQSTALKTAREPARSLKTVCEKWHAGLVFGEQGPVARSLVSANRWLRGIKMYRFPWYLTLVSANHASSNPGQGGKFLGVHPRHKACLK